MRVALEVAHEHGAVAQDLPALCVSLTLVAAGAIYAASVLRNLPERPWPTDRIGAWLCGLAAVWGALISPLAARETLFDHVLVHVLLGLVAPLLLVLAAPVTLALRALAAVPARRLAALLASPPVRVLLHPLVAAVLSAGGLWVLYTTPLYALAQPATPMAIVVDVYLFASGCLFAAAMIGSGSARVGFRLRLVLMIVVLGAHVVLGQRVVAHPPVVVAAGEATSDALLLAALAVAVDLVLIVVLWRRWTAASGGRGAVSSAGSALGGEVEAVRGDDEREPGQPEHPRGQDISEPVVSQVDAAEPDRQGEQRTDHDREDAR
ncbi:cytochrome c oxidase assembly protein [Cryobacterium tepidiphilum]|uniref:Cytochrome c oxidase assembly protein n=1 Tax=Cryobacterium tepidiphilum TaxID=2486026 RepID=A0A3M8LQ39_9MICO|nr:cytochrome c oxidase assembly protein [Cryobacterium tepidiphilum]